MKKIFIVAGILGWSFVSAQNNTDTFWIKPLNSPPRAYSFNFPKVPRHNYTPNGLDSAKLLHTQVGGLKVYALPQDHMICVVPDLSNYNMPVIKPDIRYTIPNPAHRPSDKMPSSPEEQLQKLLEPRQNK